MLDTISSLSMSLIGIVVFLGILLSLFIWAGTSNFRRSRVVISLIIGILATVTLAPSFISAYNRWNIPEGIVAKIGNSFVYQEYFCSDYDKIDYYLDRVILVYGVPTDVIIPRTIVIKGVWVTPKPVWGYWNWTYIPDKVIEVPYKGWAIEEVN